MTYSLLRSNFVFTDLLVLEEEQVPHTSLPVLILEDPVY